MNKLGTGIVGAGLLLALAGCEESARLPVQMRPPEMAASHTVSNEPLPLDSQRLNRIGIFTQRPNGVDSLLRANQTRVDAGKKYNETGEAKQARQEFDRAMNLLVSSEFDLNGDQRLAKIFEEVATTIRAHEVAASQEEENQMEPKGEPAPIEEIGEVTVSLDPRVREKAERELKQIPHDLPLTVNEHVLTYLNFFQTPRGRAVVETGLRRAGRYQDMISRVLREEGLPQDLIYLAQAESAFQPAALSRAGARGIWQFMAYRGREYGLQRSWWIDERQDPEKSTRAAARHLKDLYQEFGDWYLVMAAYNSGPGNVTKGIERTGYADFWELYRRNVLPKETRNYVPIILALTLIAKDPERYAVQVEQESPLRYDRVKPGHPVDLRLVAETLDVDLNTVKLHNSHLLRMVTPADPDFELRLPEGMGQQFETEMAAIPKDKWLSWRRHRLEPGETLAALARKYGVTVRSITDVNSLEEQGSLAVGEKLIIPAAARPQPLLGKLVRYRVRRGDTLESMAAQFDVSVADLKKWNGLRGNKVSRGVTLKVYPGGLPMGRSGRNSRPAVQGKTEVGPGRSETSGSQPLVHRVREGETLWSTLAHIRPQSMPCVAPTAFLPADSYRAGISS